MRGIWLDEAWQYKDVVGGEHPPGDVVTEWIGQWMERYFSRDLMVRPMDGATGDLELSPWRHAQAERRQKQREAQNMIGYEGKLLAGPSSVISCCADEDGPFPSSVGPAFGYDHLPAPSGEGLTIYS